MYICFLRNKFQMVATHFWPLGLSLFFSMLGLLYFVSHLAKNEAPYYNMTHFWPLSLLYFSDF